MLNHLESLLSLFDLYFLGLFRRIYHNIIFILSDVPFIIGDEDSGERQGNDQSDEPSHGAPY